MDESTYHVGLLLVDLFIPGAQSLKEKRTVLKSMKDRLRKQFNVSVAELDCRDKWQVATCGIAMIGNDQRYINQRLDHIVSFVEGCHGLEMSDYEITFL